MSSELNNNETPQVVQEIADEGISSTIENISQTEYATLTESSKQQTRVHYYSQFIGPLPPASELKTYKEIQDDLVDRVVSMAEDQQKHRMSLEVEVSNRDNRRLENDDKLNNRIIDVNSRNYIIGAVIMSGCIILGSALAILGCTEAAVSTIIVPAISGVVNFFKPMFMNKSNK